MTTTIINIISILLLIFLAYISLKEKQDKKLNWSLFYALLYTITVLPIVNYTCVELDFWKFANNNIINLPFDLFFIWTILWAIVPVYFLKGKYIVLTSLLVFWLDILLMPILEKYHILVLNKNWMVGEVLLIVFVFVPSYLWAKINYQNSLVQLRAVFQVLIMTLFFLVILPFTLECYDLIENLDFHFNSIEIQGFFIITLPALIAVKDLVTKGKGTPFPYDKTKFLVTSGVYAYCKNPIQWSFTFMFIPLSIYHQSYYLLLGSVISIAYTLGVSDYQEYQDMEQRFQSDWINYKKNVPKWYFLWKPKQIPMGTIYFDFDCSICNNIKKWFLNKQTINLEIKNSNQYSGKQLLQATYIDYLGNEYKSVKAIAHALEHINLAYASIGWLLRFPVFSFIFQAIIDAMNINENTCPIEHKKTFLK